jgi:pimeloyl-ACP methyl ester carboxylesterase
MVLPPGQREVGAYEVLVREEGLTASEPFEETAVITTTDTLCRTREEIDDAVAKADEDSVARIEANYAGSFLLVPSAGLFERPALVIVGRQDSVIGFNDRWRVFGQWPRTTFAVLDRGGHGPSIELQALHDALVGDWIDRIETCGPGAYRPKAGYATSAEPSARQNSYDADRREASA